MSHHAVGWILGVITGFVAARATRVQVFPDVIDLTIIPTGAGIGSLLLCAFGAARGYGPERIGRLTLFGTLFGGGGTAFVLCPALLV